ncbi:MAG: YihY/virulence factor BrkB family protein [candidate division Zixibacteria bacterium]|nr:YihY/virulence factor BrkB family protein [candidate division Zixibacteria bacterium]
MLKYILEFLRHYFGGLYQRIDQHHLFLLSGGLAFSLFVCIIPFVLIIFSALGNILGSSSLETQLNAFVDKIIPYDKYGAFVKKLIFDRVEEFKVYKNIAGIVGAVGLFLAASGLFSSMRTILNRVFVIDKGKQILIGKLRDFGMVILVIGFFLVSTAILPGLGLLKGAAAKTELLKWFRFSEVQSIVFAVVSYLAIFAAFFTLYYLVPYARMLVRVPALSAFWAALFWEIARRVFGYYITNFASLKQIYGTYVLIIVVAFWIYYSSIIFILGAEIGQLYRERLSRAHPTN